VRVSIRAGRQPDWAPGSEHLAELEQLLGRLARLGVRVVASQRVIHPAARAACRQLGMVPLERLSARHIGPFLRLTGAAPIGSTRLLDDKLIAAHLGRLGGLRGRLVRGLARTAVEVVSDPRPPQRAAPVCTIVLGTPSDLLLEVIGNGSFRKQPAREVSHNISSALHDYMWVVSALN